MYDIAQFKSYVRTECDSMQSLNRGHTELNLSLERKPANQMLYK